MEEGKQCGCIGCDYWITDKCVAESSRSNAMHLRTEQGAGKQTRRNILNLLNQFWLEAFGSGKEPRVTGEKRVPKGQIRIQILIKDGW